MLRELDVKECDASKADQDTNAGLIKNRTYKKTALKNLKSET